MKQALKAFVAFGIALIVVFAVRAYAFTIYTVTSDVDKTLRQGDRVMVDKVSHACLKVGDLVVYGKNDHFIGRVEALPGDTLTIGTKRYVIPRRCCKRCSCPDCKLYLLNLGPSHALVYRHQMIGIAHRLFYLPF